MHPVLPQVVNAWLSMDISAYPALQLLSTIVAAWCGRSSCVTRFFNMAILGNRKDENIVRVFFGVAPRIFLKQVLLFRSSAKSFPLYETGYVVLSIKLIVKP